MFQNSDQELKMVTRVSILGRKSYMFLHKTTQKNQIFVLYMMTEKKNFPFSVILSKTNICFRRNDRKREFLFFGHHVQNKYLDKTHNKEIPHVVQHKYLLSHPGDQLNTILFYCT